MITSIQDIEYILDKYDILGLFLVIIFLVPLIISWVCKNLFPYYFRKSKLEKMDEYKDKYIELNGYSEKTNVIHKILEAEYGRILLNERNISKQKTMIFLLHYNLCRTIKEAKKFATYLVFKESQRSLVFNKALSLSRGVLMVILLVAFFSLFLYFIFKTKQSDTNFGMYVWLTLCILSYVIYIVLSWISSQILSNSIYARNLIKKNSETIQKISSRLSELNTQEMINTEEKTSTEKLSVKTDEEMTLKDKLAVESNRTKTEKRRREKAESEKKILIRALLEKDVSIENIAKILEITPKAVERMVKNTNN